MSLFSKTVKEFFMADKAIMLAANQIGATLLPDNAQWKNRMEIRSSSSNRMYVVAQRKSIGNRHDNQNS
jgi:hypothetical protein